MAGVLRSVLGASIGTALRASAGGGDGAGAGSAWIVETFDPFSSWTYVTSGAAAAIASSVGDGIFAANCTGFTASTAATNNATITKNIDPDLDLSGVAGFWLHARVNYRQTAAQVGITTYLSHLDGLAAGSGRFQAANLIYATAVGQQPHWCPKTKFSVLDGSPSFSNPIKSWRYRIDSNTAGEQHDWDLLGVTIRERTRPTIIITQDDGWDTSYTVAFAECQSRVIPQSHYLIASLIGTAGYITLTQAQTMRTAGDYLGLHGALRWDQDTGRIATDKAGLVALGIDYQHAAFPEGQIGDGTSWNATVAALDVAGVKSARLAGGLTPTLRHRTHRHCITSYPLNNTMTQAAAKAAVDTAIESNGTVIFYGHKYGAVADSLTWVTSDFTALLDYIVTKRAAGAIDVTTIDRWWG